jgi:hypothetical protein
LCVGYVQKLTGALSRERGGDKKSALAIRLCVGPVRGRGTYVDRGLSVDEDRLWG